MPFIWTMLIDFLCILRRCEPNFVLKICYTQIYVSHLQINIDADLFMQWVFFNVPHLLWQGTPVHDGKLRGPVLLTHILERLAVDLSLPLLKTKVFGSGNQTQSVYWNDQPLWNLYCFKVNGVIRENRTESKCWQKCNQM